MAERRSAVAPSVPAQACRRGVGVGAPQAARHRCVCGGGNGGGCGLGLARLVGRLRRQGRRALSAAATPSAAARRRGCQCQYDPLSYARNFDLGGDGADDAAAGVYYSYSFSSRFVLAPSSSSSAAAAVSAPSGLSSRPVVVASH